MQLKNSTDQYGLIAKTFHWGTALLFLGAYISVYYRQWFTEAKTPENWNALHIHLSFGISIGVFVLLRLIWKCMNESPNEEPGSRLEHLAAKAGHYALYAVMIIMPLGKEFMELFQINPTQFSLIVSVYSFSAGVVSFIGASMLDRFDRKKALLYLYIGFTLGTWACAFAPTYATFLLARVVSGGFGGILTAVVLSIIGDVIPFQRRAQATSYVMMAFSVSSVIGVPLGIWIATNFGWRWAFHGIAGISAVFILLITFYLPSMTQHLVQEYRTKNPFKAFWKIIRSSNERSALIFSMAVIFGHFSIIPFLTPYMQLNIGLTDDQVTYMYFIGGVSTVFALPLVGRLSDRYGNQKIFILGSLFAICSIYTITNLPLVSLALALTATTSYFIASSSRNVPTVTLVTSVVTPENRGSFMSIRTSVNQFSMGLSAFIAGNIIIRMPDGSLSNYPIVGYFAIGMTLLSLFLVSRLRVVS